MSIEKDLYDFIKEEVDGSSNGDTIFGIEVQPTPYSEFKSDRGVAVWHCQADLNPDYVEDDPVIWLDAVVTINCYASAGRDKTMRADARESAVELSGAIAALFFDDETMGGRARNTRAMGVRTGMDSTDGKWYAIAHLAVVVNETFQLTQRELEARAFRQG